MSVFHLTDRQDKLEIQEKLEEMFLCRIIHRSVLMKVKVSPRGKSFDGTLFTLRRNDTQALVGSILYTQNGATKGHNDKFR